MSIDLGVVALRVLVGLLFVGHGAQKLFGWFGGYGLGGTSGWLGSLGLRPARTWALMAGLSEFGGGLLLLLGLANPVGPLGIVGAMAMAIGLVHWGKGLWATNGGIEYPLVLLVLSAALGLAGPGSFSLDALAGIALPAAPIFAAGLVGIVVVVSVALAMTGQRVASGADRAT